MLKCKKHTQETNLLLFLHFGGRQGVGDTLIVPFSSVHRTNCAILTVRSPHFLSIYCDFIKFNVANNEMESKRNFTFFETENHWPYIYIV